ncbi:MAG: TIM barrel protein [Dehalococcoidales bacterium]|nr:TIM barrel protein [Dehalococcoidales bacterium]
MNDNLHSYMKVGIVQLMAYPETDTVESIRKIAEDEFFGAIEIATVPEDIRDEVMQILGASHLVIGYVGQALLVNNKLDLNSLVPQQREAAISMIKGGVDEAYMLGARQLAVLSGPAPAKSKYDQAKELLIDSLSQICSYAQSKGDLGIAMEIFDREYDKKCLIGPTPEAVEVAREVKRNYPNFGLMIDLSHLPLLKEKPDYAVKTAKNYLAHVHIGSCILKDKSHPAYGDKHPPFGLAAGENDVEEVRLFLKALMEIGYIGAGKQNVVAFEVKPLSGQNPDVVVANAKRTLMEAWARL